MQHQFRRIYILLQPLRGSGGGFARLECRHGRCSITIRASLLPDEPVRALLFSGDASTGAVTDLGLMQAGTLTAFGPTWHASCHTLMLAADWPRAEPLLYGALRPQAECCLPDTLAALRRYLSLPAPGSRSAPFEWPAPAPQHPVLHLRSRLSP